MVGRLEALPGAWPPPDISLRRKGEKELAKIIRRLRNTGSAREGGVNYKPFHTLLD